MGKKKSHNPQVSLNTQDRKERVLLNEVDRVRATLPTPAYLAWCRQQCRKRGGLEFDSVRAVIWRDLLLLIPQASSTSLTPSSSGVFSGVNNNSGRASSVNAGASIAGNSSSNSNTTTTSSTVSGRHFMLAPSVPYAGGTGDGGALSPNCHLTVLDCDIKRSLWHLYPNDTIREEKRQLVKSLIMRCLSHRPQLHYYQGLHEVVGFVEYTVGAHVPRETLVAMVDQLLSQHFYAFCHQNMKSCEGILHGVHFALKVQCPELAAMLEELQLGPGTHFALPWVITWFTHHLAESHP
ncbi:GTPase activating protein of Rab-like GTPase, putative, partial [Bodo saltans]